MIPTPGPSVAPGSPKPEAPSKAETPDKPFPDAPQNFGPDVAFSKLAKLFDALSDERKQARKRKLLEKWFNSWRRDVGNDLFPALRLILPQKDRERAVYGLKEKALANVYIKMIPLQKKDPDAQRMLYWKKPTERYATAGDFPAVLYEVVQKRSSVLEGTLTIQELNDILDRLSKTMGKSEDQAKILQRVYNKTTAAEQKWIVRIILKDMNISVKEKTVFSVFHPDAEDLYNACSDLKRIAWQLWNPNTRLNPESKEISLFEAFLPMLCQRPKRNLRDVVKEMGGREFIIEEKLDGERMQLHKRGNEYFYCSRKGKDYTYLYGQTVGKGSLTPHIHNAFDPRVDEIILDGEMLVWDPVSERHLPFGNLKTFAAHDDELNKPGSRKRFNPRPCFKVFDMLYLNGKCCTGMSVEQRKKNMRQCFVEKSGYMEYAVEFRAHTEKDIRRRMDEVMSNRGEGLVVKHPLAKYVLNGRTNDWFKVKPEYMDNLGETVDVIVVGGNYGTGRRAGGVSTMLCAVLDDSDPGDEPVYSTFVRIGSGFSFADFVRIRGKNWKTWDPKNPPHFLRTSKIGQEDKCDLYLEPEDSFIVKVKAAEVVASEKYYSGYTLRFPRALGFREDLSIDDCMLASDILERIRRENKRKNETEHGDRPKKVRKTKKVVVTGVAYSGTPLKKVRVEDHLFDGWTFAVLRNDDLPDPQDEVNGIMEHVKAHGGIPKTVMPKSASNPLYVYSGTTKYSQIQRIISSGIYDVIKPEWITDSIDNKELAPFKRKYFFHATESRREHPDYEIVDEDDEVSESENGAASVPVQEQEATPATQDEGSVTQPSAPLDPELAEWFDVGETEEVLSPEKEELGEDSDNDSDNDDINREDDEDDLQEWFQVSQESTTQDDPETAMTTDTQDDVQSEDVKMGEDDDAMHYDTEKIFRHLCFYLDSPENASKNGMKIKTKQADRLNKDFEEAGRKIIENGGRIGSLEEPKLTHVIIHKGDDSRRTELMKRTSKPKHRNLVILEWVDACLDEGTLLPEEDFMP